MESHLPTCFEKAPMGGVEMEIGVLFADVRGFTSLAESNFKLGVGIQGMRERVRQLNVRIMKKLRDIARDQKMEMP